MAAHMAFGAGAMHALHHDLYFNEAGVTLWLPAPASTSKSKSKSKS